MSIVTSNTRKSAWQVFVEHMRLILIGPFLLIRWPFRPLWAWDDLRCNDFCGLSVFTGLLVAAVFIAAAFAIISEGGLLVAKMLGWYAAPASTLREIAVGYLFATVIRFALWFRDNSPMWQ